MRTRATLKLRAGDRLTLTTASRPGRPVFLVQGQAELLKDTRPWPGYLVYRGVGLAGGEHLQEIFQRVVVEQVNLEEMADAVVARVEILVEDVGRGIVLDAVAEVFDHVSQLALVGVFEEYR